MNLVNSLPKSLGLKLRIEVANSVDEMIQNYWQVKET